MTDRDRTDRNCHCCGTAVASQAVVTDAGAVYCSSGCRTINDALERVERTERGGKSDGSDETETDGETEADDETDGDNETDADDETDDGTGATAETVRTHLRVDGMYAATCEAFLEFVAERMEGVTDAAASYVTEAVRVDHDPDRVSGQDLERALSTVGYTAYLRESARSPNESVGRGPNESGDKDRKDSNGESEGPQPADATAGTTRRSREIHGVRKRRSDDMLEVRYVVGVVFGTFVLLPYVALLYPVYLASVVDVAALSIYDGAFESLDDPLFLVLFTVLAGAVLYATGMPLLRSAYVSLTLRRATTDLLAALVVTSAFAYATLAVLLGRNDVYFDVTIVVAAVVTGAAFYEAATKRRAVERLADLTISQVSSARLFDADGTTRTVSTDDLTVGDRILVRQGERVPVDGILRQDACTVDEAVLTGNALPRSIRPGEAVVGGSVVTGGAAVLEATGETSAIDRLTHAVWDFQSVDRGTERSSDRIASRALPLIVLAVLGVGIAHLAVGTSLSTTALLVLLTVMVTSPWALALATRLSVATSIREALTRGIVVFDGSIFERLREIDVVVFDKTGTLTTGRMRVLEADAPAETLSAAAALEERSSHPVATAIASAFETNAAPVRSFRSHSTGVEGIVDDAPVLVGHPGLFADRDWDVDASLERQAGRVREGGRLPVFVGRNGRAEGVIVVGDEPRENWAQTVDDLAERGVDVVVLTGDDEAPTGTFDAHPGIEHVFAGVPPTGKVEAIRRLAADRTVAMVGDGTNDAPALATADLGVSLGSGTALAADAADLAILEDDLGAVEAALAMAATSRRRLERGLGLAFLYNVIAIPFALAGFLNPLFATGAIALTCLGIAAAVYQW